MGEVRKYTCSCGYSKELPIGAGMMGVNVSSIKNNFPETALEEFLKEKEAGHITDYLNQNQLGICENCQSLIVASHLAYTKQDGSKKHIINGCPECGNQFTLVNNPDDVSCPKCGKPLTYELTGHWD